MQRIMLTLSVIIHFKIIVKDKCSRLYKAYLKSWQISFDSSSEEAFFFCGWIRDVFVHFQFSPFLCLFPQTYSRGEELEYDLPGYRVKPDVCRKISKVLIGVNQKECPSREVKTKMALHSEAEAEESHQEQGECAERLGDHDTSTWDTQEMKACQFLLEK